MRKIILFLIYTFIGQNIFAHNTDNKSLQSSLEGYVYDASTKQPLVNATIFIHEINIKITTNNTGYFKTTNITNGKYLVEISYVGFATIVEQVEINGQVKKDFTLQTKVTEQEAVTVTGTTSATRIKLMPQPVTIVSAKDLQKTASTNVIDALSKNVAGFNALTTGAAIAKPVIRGLGYNRVLTINDGVRQEGQQWGDEHGIEIDEASVIKAEVLKGAASLTYGSDAMAGVVNLISNEPVPVNTLKANANTAYMSNNDMFSLHANIAAHFKNGINFNVYGSSKMAGDYSNAYDGKVLNSRFKENNYGGYIGINKHWGFAHLLVSVFNQKLGVVEGKRDSATGRFLIYAETPDERIATDADLNSKEFVVPYQQIQHFKVTNNNSFYFNKTRLTTSISFQNNIRKEFGSLPVTDQADLHLDLKTVGYNVQYHFAEKKNYKTSMGVSGMYQTNKNYGSELLIPNYNLFDVGAFIVTKKTFDKINVTGGLRYDVRNVNTESLADTSMVKFVPVKKTFSNISGSIGASFLVNDNLTLKANIARGFRAPSVIELSSNGAHEGTYRYEVGDNNLQSEQSLQTDMGIDFATEHFSFSTNIFLNNINNYIFYNKLAAASGADSTITQDGQVLQMFQFKQANANLYGFEMNVDLHPHPLDWLHFKNSFSYVRGEFAHEFGGSKNLSFMPQPRLLSELKVEFPKWGKQLSNIYAKLEADNFFAQKNVFTSFNTETETPAYTLLNFAMGADVMKNKKQLFNIYFLVNNIADITYQNHLSRLKYTDTNYATGRNGVFNMGRNFVVKVNIPLGWNLK